MSHSTEQSAGCLAQFGTRAAPISAWKTQAGAALLLGGAGYLLWFSLQLAATRVYSVDECAQVAAAHALAGASAHPSGPITVFQLILSRLLPAAASSANLFSTARLVSLMIFWVNWIVLASATGARVFSPRWMVAFFGAAALTPFWATGFEVRPENLLLTGILVFWCVVRVRPAGLQSYLLAGAIACGLQFFSPNAIIFTLPLSLALVLAPRREEKHPRWQLALAWFAGAAAVLVVLRVALGITGRWDAVIAGLKLAQIRVVDGRIVPSLGTVFGRLFAQSPLLMALVASGLACAAMDFRRRGRAALAWDSIAPEALLMALALAVLLVSPEPYPANLLALIPIAYLFAFRHGSDLVAQLRGHGQVLPMTAGLLAFVVVVPLWRQLGQESEVTNLEQANLMGIAESLTDPAKDTVWDAVGFVPTRENASSLARRAASNNSESGLVEMPLDGSGKEPAAVIIPNYRTDQVPPATRDFIRDHYVSVADSFLVLGKILPAGGGNFEIVHPGRYRLATAAASDLAGTYRADLAGFLEAAKAPKELPLSGTLDGAPLADKPVLLSAGAHHLECAQGVQPVVEWVGPQQTHLPRLGRTDHRELFAESTGLH